MVQQKLTKQNWPFNNPILSIILSICKRDKFLCARKWWTSRDIPKNPQTGKNNLPFFAKPTSSTIFIRSFWVEFLAAQRTFWIAIAFRQWLVIHTGWLTECNWRHTLLFPTVHAFLPQFWLSQEQTGWSSHWSCWWFRNPAPGMFLKPCK